MWQVDQELDGAKYLNWRANGIVCDDVPYILDLPRTNRRRTVTDIKFEKLNKGKSTLEVPEIILSQIRSGKVMAMNRFEEVTGLGLYNLPSLKNPDYLLSNSKGFYDGNGLSVWFHKLMSQKKIDRLKSYKDIPKDLYYQLQFEMYVKEMKRLWLQLSPWNGRLYDVHNMSVFEIKKNQSVINEISFSLRTFWHTLRN